MISQPGFEVQDQWQVQIQAQIQQRAEVFVFSEGLSNAQIQRALFTPTRDIERTLVDLVANRDGDVRICVIPEGPQLIPYLDGK